MGISLKRVYDPPAPDDGTRILVDRLWPRGESKERAELDLWLKDLAPSSELREWFGHDPAKWDEFRTRYAAELDTRGESLHTLRREIERGPVTLLYAAKDTEHNNAVALREYLRSNPTSSG